MEVSEPSPLPPRSRLVCFLATDSANARRVLATCEPDLYEPVGLGVGVLLTPDHVRGGRVRAPWNRLMPTREEARMIGSFTTARLAPLTLHARSGTERTEELLTELASMFEYLGRVPDLLHLDNDPYLPSADVIGVLRGRHPELRLIVHVGTMVQARHQDDPVACVTALVARYGAHLASHGGPISHALWDGCGRRRTSELDPRQALRFVEALQRQAPGVEPVLSGRVGPETLSILDPVWNATRKFSTLAHRQLTNGFGEPVDPERTIRYVQGVLRRLAAS